MGAAPRTEPATARTERPLAESMAELLGASAPSAQAPGRTPRIEPAPAPPEATSRGYPVFSLATEMADGTLVGGVLALYIGLAAALISPRGVPTQLTGIDGVMARVHQLSSVLAPCVALALVLGLVYAAAFALLWNGRTPGRRLLGIRLVDRSGLAPTPGRAITRAALAVVSFVPFLAGFWLALFDRRGQTLHDKLTQTFVIRPG